MRGVQSIVLYKQVPKLSIVWKHFVDIGQGYARCKICQKEVKGCGNTTNFTFHLERTHRMALNKAETKATKSIKRKLSHSRKKENVEAESVAAISCEKENVQAESMAAISSISTDSQTETACATSSINHSQSWKPKQPRVDDTFAKQLSFQSGSKATEMNCKLCFMLAKDNMPLNTVEKEGFQEFVKALNPLYKLPCRNITTALIEEKYSYLSDIIKKRLSGIKVLSLTTDIWTESFNSKSFLGLTVHYLFDDECKSIIIGVKELDERHTSNNIKVWLISMLDEWGIELGNVVAVISDNAANIKKAIIDAFGADKHLPCFAHTLNLVPSKIIASDELISPVITKIKTIVTYIKKSVEASDLLRLHSKLKLIQSVETRWNSTYDMLVRFMELIDVIGPIMLKCSAPPPMLSALEVRIVKEFIELLGLFEEATKILCGEYYITASKTIPVISTLKNKLEIYSPFTDSAKHLKKCLIEQFNKRFENIEKISLLAVSTLLDPRFKKIHFRDKIACSRAIDKISKVLSYEVLLQKKKSATYLKVEKSIDENQNFWTYHNNLVLQNNLAKESLNEGALADDLKYFLNQPNLKMDENPIKYWNSNSHSSVSNLAKNYLSIVATSVPSERLFSKAGRIITRDRSRLKSTHLQQLLFLSSLPKEDWLFNN